MGVWTAVVNVVSGSMLVMIKVWDVTVTTLSLGIVTVLPESVSVASLGSVISEGSLTGGFE